MTNIHLLVERGDDDATACGLEFGVDPHAMVSIIHADVTCKKCLGCECIEGDAHLCAQCAGDAIDGAEYALADR